MPATTKLLRRFPFFEHVSPSELTQLAASATRHTLTSDTIIVRQGEMGDAFYMIVSGSVEVFNAADKTRLNLLGAGEWFGEFALLDNQPRSATVRTRTNSVLISLPKEKFVELVTKYPLVLLVLAASTQQQLRTRDQAYIAEVETRMRQLEQVYYTALDITRHLDRHQALQAIRERAVELLNAAGGEIYLYDSQTKLLMPQASLFGSQPYRVGEDCAGAAFAQGKVRIETSNRRTLCHELAAPIQLSEANGQERQLGVLRVYRASDGMPFENSDCTLLELFASQAATVIENADLIELRIEQGQLERELQNARRVQRQLIPAEPPEIRGYQIAAMWYPAKQVSGDYYDFIPLPDKRVAFVIADVSGKGLDAALFMANTRATLRACALAGERADEIIACANETLTDDSPGGMFVTIFFGILDPIQGVFTYINAGHNPPLLFRASTQAIRVLETGDRALGITAGNEYHKYELTLEHNDLLLLYTDGVTEATNAEEQFFEMTRLEDAVYSAAAGSALQVIRQIDKRVRAFTGAYPQSDDITVVALRRT